MITGKYFYNGWGVFIRIIVVLLIFSFTFQIHILAATNGNFMENETSSVYEPKDIQGADITAPIERNSLPYKETGFSALPDPSIPAKDDKKVIPSKDKSIETEQKGDSNPEDVPIDNIPEYRDFSRDVVKGEQFKTEPLTGALRYEYPIQVPPGRNNLSPDLKLTYTNSPSENMNIYGYGWSDNIPYIQRINRYGTDNLYNSDPNYSGFFYSTFDGELQLTGATSSSYGAKVDAGEMRSYSFISNAWVVTDKFGKTYKFGTASSSRQDDPANADHVFKWQLDEVRDTNGNYIKYEYYKNVGQIYPSRIVYTGNASTDGPFEVIFLRQARTDVASSSQSSFGVTTNYRIYQIKTQVDGVWAKKYDLSYGTAATGLRSVLHSIIENGWSNDFATSTLPATTFNYMPDDYPVGVGWSAHSSPAIPDHFVAATGQDNGVRLVDVNGDGLIDVMVGRIEGFPATTTLRTYLKTPSGWVVDNNWAPPVPFMNFTISPNRTLGVELADVNGDGLIDVINHPHSTGVNTTYINNGNGWTASSTWQTPTGAYFLYHPTVPNQENGGRLVDVNGDGLTDILMARLDGTSTSSTAYINNGAGWTVDNNWASPEPFVTWGNIDRGVRLADVNGDNLVDVVYGPAACSSNDSKIYINSGHGWTLDANWSLPTGVGFAGYSAGQPTGDRGARFADLNGDGLVDIIYKSHDLACHQGVYLNDGAAWNSRTDWYSTIPVWVRFVGSNNEDFGTRIADLNGDGMDDLVWARTSGSNILYSNVTKKNDVLWRAVSSKGAVTTFDYKMSALYVEGSNYASPNLPQNYQTVEKIVTNDGLGNVATSTYSYGGGDYYYNGTHDRQLGGFQTITKTDPAGNTTKTFYHQGNSSDTSNGEVSDYFSKIGRPYRIEVADNNSNIYTKNINRWDTSTTTNNRQFVSLGQSIELTYDGDGTHKDKAETYSYATSTGNLIQKISYGEVSASNDGSFSDIGTDDFTTTLAYAVSTTTSVTGLVSNETVLDSEGNKVRETKHYYDSLALGDVSLGNETKDEGWVSASNYINSQKTYNNYGLVTTSKDPRGKITSYVYDQYNLFPATSTNPLGHTTAFSYNYLIGKPTQVKDVNGYIFQVNYDGLGRVKEEKIPDNTNPSTLVTKTAYSYIDNAFPNEVYKKDYLNSATSTSSYTYLDGLGRVIQTRTEGKDSNTFSIKDVSYNSIGKILKESLPYYSVGASTTQATTTSLLYINYTYDPLGRVKSVSNALGTTTNTYDDWKLTVTDPMGKVRDLTKDAYDNLIKVDEYNSNETYTTNYEWNGNKNLTKITDALGNVRNFTYDGLGKVLIAEDLHNPADSTYGTWAYEYDNSGNLASSTDPVGHNIVYVYDDINRRLSEDNTAVFGTEVEFGYDNCNGGIGKLCFATTTAIVLKNEWSPNGQIKKETKKIFNSSYVTYYNHDRQGNILTIIHPDLGSSIYAYNNAGLLDKIVFKNSAGQPQTLVSGLSYSPLKQITHLTYGNNASTTNTYDASKLYRLSNKLSGKTGGKFQDLTYTYDAVGNVTRIVDNSNTNTAKTTDYFYDDLHRLISASTTAAVGSNYLETYTYSPIGNISSKSDLGTYLYQGDQGNNFANPHAVTSINGIPTTYDRAGNLISNGIATSTWNFKNQLVRVTSTATTTSYFYDMDGNRLTQKINSQATTTTVTPYYELAPTPTRRAYIGDELIATIVGTEQLAADYGGSDDEDVSPGGLVVHYIHGDHLGGSNVSSDQLANLEELTDYYPYGKIKTNTSTTGFKERKKFTGHEYDVDTELTYMKARYQDPATGRFLSQDPAFQSVGNPQTLKEKTGLDIQKYLEDPQNLNSYSYVKNNPLKYKDPTGEWFQEFLTGQQSWNSFQGELGQAANQLSQDSAVWNAAISHPVAAGAVVGVAGGAVALGASAGLTYLSTEYLGGIGTACVALCSQADKGQKLLNLNSLEVVSSAETKLQNLTNQFGMSKEQILQRASEVGQKFVDLRNNGNVNILMGKPNGAEGFIRVTTDPTLSRVISAGQMQLNNVINNINNGNFIPLR